MSETMTRWGVGPRFATFSLIAAFIAIAFNYVYFPWLIIHHSTPVLLTGIILILMGVLIFFIATYQVHRAFSAGRLVTGGVYGYIRHPVYAVWILFFVPGLFLITGIVFLIFMPFFMYGLFKILIVREEVYLEQKFGEQYVEYKKRVNAIIPKLI
jgi:protein-S-isoprenylcysteine O-methyltransferase Ste14